MLWASLTIGVLRGVLRQLAIWRLVTDQGWWRERHVWVSDEAVSQRLAVDGPSPLADLVAQFRPLVAARVEAHADRTLAPVATDVVVREETTLEPGARTWSPLRGLPAGDHRLLPGKLAGVFDGRRPLWRTLDHLPTPHQNEQVAARDLVAALVPGTLILADLGYFSFAWCDDLTAAGPFWLSRLRAQTSARVAPVFSAQGAIFAGLVWLGADRADRATHLVRLVRFRGGKTTHA